MAEYENFTAAGGGAVAVSGFDDLIARFEAAEKEDRLEAVLCELGEQMQAEMNRNIGPHDTLKNAQELRTKIKEKKGGYVAIKPRTGGYRITGKRYLVKTKTGKHKAGTGDNGIKAWDLTRFTNDGHAIRTPKGQSKRYRARIKVPFVEGKGYYDKTRKWAESAGLAAINRLADEIAQDLDGQ